MMVGSKTEDIFVKDNDKTVEPANATKWFSNTSKCETYLITEFFLCRGKEIRSSTIRKVAPNHR
jgi:hypothetical protein